MTEQISNHISDGQGGFIIPSERFHDLTVLHVLQDRAFSAGNIPVKLEITYVPISPVELTVPYDYDCRPQTSFVFNEKEDYMRYTANYAFSIRARMDPPDLVFPAALKEIGTEAFSGIAATAVSIPSGITKIENNAFANCSKLKQVFIPASVKTIIGTPFPANTLLFCVEGSAGAAYAQNNGNPCLIVSEP